MTFIKLLSGVPLSIKVAPHIQECSKTSECGVINVSKTKILIFCDVNLFRDDLYELYTGSSKPRFLCVTYNYTLSCKQNQEMVRLPR